MEDARVWAFEQSLWQASDEHYHESIADDCVTVVPTEPYLLVGQAWADAASATPDWDDVTFLQQQVSRPQEGLIVIGYHVAATRGDERYEAWCTTTMRRRGHEDWVVVQHQQTPPLVLGDPAG